MEDIEKYFIIGMITPNGFAHVPTFYVAFQQALLMGKMPRLFMSSKGQHGEWASARTHVLEQIHEAFPDVSEVRMLWIDSDIMLKNPMQFSEVIKYAYEKDYNIVGNYHNIHGDKVTNTIYKRGKTDYMWDSLTDSDIEKLCKDQNTDYPIIEGAGLGFYYGRVPIDYKFHQDKQGEDFWFYTDCDFYQFRLASKLELAHWKEIPL